jgi:hypothetical protein
MSWMLLSLLAVAPAAEVSPVLVVVPDARVSGGVDADFGGLVTDELARMLTSGAFKVTTAAQLSTVLGLERQRQLMGCGEDSTSCAAELANALGAEVVTMTSVAKVGEALHCNLTFLSGKDGAALKRLSIEETSDGALLARLHAELAAAVPPMFASLRPGHRLEGGSEGVRRYAWAPAVAGGALAIGSGALFAITGSTWNTLNTSDKLSPGDARGLAASGKSTQTLAWAAGGAALIALGASAAMFTLGAPSDPSVVVAPVASGSGGGVSISGVFR